MSADISKYMKIAGENDGLIADYCWQKALEKSLKTLSTEAQNHAILFFGGVNPANNHARYYENLKKMYEEISRKVKPENITVLYADGTNPAPDKHIGEGWIENSDLSFLHPSTAVLPATRENLEKTCSIIKNVTEENDRTLFYAFGHGAKLPGQSGEVLCGWNGEVIPDKDFAEMIQSIGGYKTLVFAECYSGGMAEDILLDDKTSVIAASTKDQVTYDDGFASGVAESLRLDNISTHQLAHSAAAKDHYALSGMEQPMYGGADFSVFHPVTDDVSLSPQDPQSFDSDAILDLGAEDAMSDFAAETDGGDSFIDIVTSWVKSLFE